MFFWEEISHCIHHRWPQQSWWQIKVIQKIILTAMTERTCWMFSNKVLFSTFVEKVKTAAHGNDLLLLQARIRYSREWWSQWSISQWAFIMSINTKALMISGNNYNNSSNNWWKQWVFWYQSAKKKLLKSFYSINHRSLSCFHKMSGDSLNNEDFRQTTLDIFI